jgi:O-antigen/teichoic acid export membrane protein
MFPAMSDAAHDAASGSVSLDSADAGARFIRGGLLRTVTFGGSMLASIVSVPLVIRHLGATDYGYFATVTAIIFIVGGFTEGGLNSLGIREYASGRPDRIEMLRNLIGLRVSATAVAVVISAIIAVAIGTPHVISYGILVSGAGLIVTIAGENYSIPLTADLRLTAASVIGLIQQIGLAITYVVLVVIGARVLPLLGATIVSGLVLLAGTAVVLRQDVPLIPALDRRVWRELLAQTLPYAAATAVGIIYFREALVLISALSSAQEAGYYAAAFRIVEVLAAIPWTLVSSAFPILARAAHTDDEGRLAYAMGRLFDTSLIMGAWMSACVLVGAPFGIAVVAGPAFKSSVPVLQIQGLAIITSFMVALFGSMLLSLRLFKPLVWSNALAVVVATALSLALIPAAGARGAAVAPTAAEAALAIAYAVSLARARPSLRVSLALVPRIALATGISIAVAYALPISSAVALVVLSAVYAVCLWLFKAIPFEVVNALLRRSPPADPVADAPSPRAG